MTHHAPHLLPSLLLALLCLPLSASGQGDTREYSRATTGEDGAFLYWRDRHISYVVDSDGCPDADLDHTTAAVVRAFNAWEGHPCTDVFFDFVGHVGGLVPDHVYDEHDDEPDGYNLIIWLDEWPWSPDQLAQTRIIWNDRTGEILDVDIFMNGVDYYWTSTDRTVTDIENVLAHEVGHMLGFAHTSDPEATMYDGYTEGETVKRDIAGTDIRGLCEVYPSGEPTPDVPGLSRDDIELSSGGCECSAAPRGPAGLSVLALAAAFLFLRRKPLGPRADNRTCGTTHRARGGDSSH